MSWRGSAAAKQPRLIGVGRLDGERQRSFDSGVGISKTPVACDECKAKIKTLRAEIVVGASPWNHQRRIHHPKAIKCRMMPPTPA
jgi:hypothetical protein